MQIRYEACQTNFNKIPGSPIAYWVSNNVVRIYANSKFVGDIADVRHGMSTGMNEKFVRRWYEINYKVFDKTLTNRSQISNSNGKYFPYNKGGDFRKWYGNAEYVIWYDVEGQDQLKSMSGFRHDGRDQYFHEGITWSFISSSNFGVRYLPSGFVFDVAGSSMFLPNIYLRYVCGVLCSNLGAFFMEISNPTLNFQVGNLKTMPLVINDVEVVDGYVDANIGISKVDWDSFETSWDFKKHPLI